MIEIGTFVNSVAFLVVAMALLAVVETVVPFFRKDWRRRHAAPNLSLTALSLAVNFTFNAAAVVAAGLFSPHRDAPSSGSAIPSIGNVLLAFVVLDASTYLCHRSMHWLPFMWKVHRVHHSDPLVDVTTALRLHPIETAWRFLFILVPAALFGLSPGAVAAYRAASAFMALFEHMNAKLWQPLDTVLSFVVGTPNMHKLHHSRRAAETDTNYGNILSLFDRLFGTFTPSVRAESVDCGLEGYDTAESQELGALLRLPFDPDIGAESAVAERHAAPRL
jgi:sterol desaturase/sphingolipid hydroxylase (fatty acid hydroxylase superfamily)